LTDGAVISEDHTSVPVSLAQLLADSDGMLAQLDPEKIRAITDELRVSQQGPQKLAALLDGGAFLISTVDSVLPQTMSVLRNSRTVLTTLADAAPALDHTAQNLRRILAGVNAMDGGFRTLVDRGDAPLTALDGIIDHNSATMVQLLGNLTTVGQLAAARVPALDEMLNSQRGGSALAAVSTIVHDGYFWVLVDIYPRYGCDYDLPRLPPFLANYPEPYLIHLLHKPRPVGPGPRRPQRSATARRRHRRTPTGLRPPRTDRPHATGQQLHADTIRRDAVPPQLPTRPTELAHATGLARPTAPGLDPAGTGEPTKLEGDHHGDQTLQANQRQGRLRQDHRARRPARRRGQASHHGIRGFGNRRQPEKTPITPRRTTRRPRVVSGGCATPSPR
jgi:hypothetical protein